MFSVTPKFLIEAVSMAALFVILAIVLYAGKNLEEIILVVSVVAIAAMRFFSFLRLEGVRLRVPHDGVSSDRLASWAVSAEGA